MFLSTSNVKCLFPFGKTVRPQNWLLICFESNTIRKNIGNRQRFRGKNLQQQQQNLEIVQEFSCEAKNFRNLRRFRIFIFCFSFLLVHFFIFCFFQEKIHLFLLSFKHVSLLALVPKFNFRCILRSRCSTEMWCPEDIGRYSLDWVGPPTRESMIQFPSVGCVTPRKNNYKTYFVERHRQLKRSQRQVTSGTNCARYKNYDTESSKLSELQGKIQVHENHFHEKIQFHHNPLSSKTNFIKIQVHQNPIPSVSSKQFHQNPISSIWTLSSKNTFINNHFHHKSN